MPPFTRLIQYGSSVSIIVVGTTSSCVEVALELVKCCSTFNSGATLDIIGSYVAIMYVRGESEHIRGSKIGSMKNFLTISSSEGEDLVHLLFQKKMAMKSSNGCFSPTCSCDISSRMGVVQIYFLGGTHNFDVTFGRITT